MFLLQAAHLLGQLGVDWGRKELLGRNTLFFSRSFLRQSENSTATFISYFPCELKVASWCFVLYSEVTERVRQPDCALVHPQGTSPLLSPLGKDARREWQPSSENHKIMDVIVKGGSMATLELHFLPDGTFISQDSRMQEGGMERGWCRFTGPGGRVPRSGATPSVLSTLQLVPLIQNSAHCPHPS